jgi:TolA-binding protein
MKKYELSAAQFRLILSISLFLILAIMLTVAGFSYNELKKVAVNVSHISADANASSNNVETLEQIKQKLNDDKDVITRTNNIVAESKSYQYQDQIIADLKDYANRAGIVLTNFDFSSTATTSTPGSNAAPTPPPTAPPPSGVKSTTVSVALKNPINYENLLKFLQSIERNLTKMQISKVSLTKSESDNSVSSDALTIEVYVR